VEQVSPRSLDYGTGADLYFCAHGCFCIAQAGTHAVYSTPAANYLQSLVDDGFLDSCVRTAEGARLLMKVPASLVWLPNDQRLTDVQSVRVCLPVSVACTTPLPPTQTDVLAVEETWKEHFCEEDIARLVSAKEMETLLKRYACKPVGSEGGQMAIAASLSPTSAHRHLLSHQCCQSLAPTRSSTRLLVRMP
jgi:hypothetical protein